VTDPAVRCHQKSGTGAFLERDVPGAGVEYSYVCPGARIEHGVEGVTVMKARTGEGAGVRSDALFGVRVVGLQVGWMQC
jgi:hypothetical protein